jgi:hypothetical protein
MRLLEAMRHTARFSVNPTFSLFGVTSRGEYSFIEKSTNAELIVERFKAECVKPDTVGLEIRADGSRVSFDHV